MEYNATREHLQMREYGRHVQKMVDFILTVEDPESRQRQAESVVELMSFLNPQLKAIEDYKHKLWDHLYVISDFKLDVESPYGRPARETYKTKPSPLRYPKRKPKYNHLGKHLELVIDKAMAEENPEKKDAFGHVIAHYMKLAYSNWHKELVHDDGIRQELNNITKGELEFTNTPFVRHRANAFNPEETFVYPKKNNNRNFRNNRNGGQQGNAQQGNGRNSNGGQNRNNNNGQNRNNKFKKRFGQ